MIEGARTKKGPKYSTGATLTDGGLTLSMSSSTAAIRLSRNEYLQLTQGNNLSRQNLNSEKLTYPDPVNTLSATEPIRSSMDSDLSKNWLVKINEIKEVDVKEKNVRRLKNLNYNNKSGDLGIKINSTKFYDTLLKTSDDNKPTLSVIDEQRGHKSNFVEDFKKTAIDEFNLDILHSKDWGKNVLSSAQIALSQFPKPSQKIFDKTLGMKSKFPRDRGTMPYIQKSKSSNRLNGFAFYDDGTM